MFTTIDGIFYRSIDPQHRTTALTGSVRAGRYSRPDEQALYLSASREGAVVAMRAHTAPGDPPRTIIAVRVSASRIFDLRDEAACAEAGIDRGRIILPWQAMVHEGGEAPSWHVADTVRMLGANGLIDPSRRAPGLWHLVLFHWNVPDGADVSLLDT